MTLEEFLKLKLPIYLSMDKQEDPQRFIDRNEKVHEALKCLSQRIVELATFQLQDVV